MHKELAARAPALLGFVQSSQVRLDFQPEATLMPMFCSRAVVQFCRSHPACLLVDCLLVQFKDFGTCELLSFGETRIRSSCPGVDYTLHVPTGVRMV